MGQHESITSTAKSELSPDEAVAAAVSSAEITPRMALASARSPQMDLSRVVVEQGEMDALNGPKLDLTSIEAPRCAPEMEETKPTLSEEGLSEMAADAEPVPDPAGQRPSPRLNRFTLLAACLALAAALGGMIGALAAFTITRPQAVAVLGEGKLTPEEIQALKENVVQARVELAALKASLDAGNRGATTQLTRIAERVERIERNAGEPTAKLTKAADALERLARSELTGSIAPPQAIGGGAGKVDGWVLRDVRRGVAFLEGRAGTIEVEQGDLVPGLGRVDAIRKQDGRWIVVTSKGVISAAR
jgi:hypothetical protein